MMIAKGSVKRSRFINGVACSTNYTVISVKEKQLC